MSNQKADARQWTNFIRDFVSLEDGSNMTQDFGKITQKAGVAYFEYLRAAWVCNDGQRTEEEFCKINGNVPIKFFHKNIRDHVDIENFKKDTVIFSYDEADSNNEGQHG